MRRPNLTVGTFALVVGAVLALGACTAAALGAATGAPGTKLRVGIATFYPPLAFKQDGQITGVEADFAARVGKALDVKLTIVELPWNELIPALQDSKIDVIMSGMSITPAREKQVTFTHPYMTISQMALYRAGDAARLRAELGAKTLRIGVVSGTTGEQYARKKYPQAQVTGFATVDDGVAALRKGEVDVFIHDSPAIWRVTGGLESSEAELAGYYEPLTEEHLAWAVRRRNGAPLWMKLNKLIERWKADGTIESVIDRWIPVRKKLIRPHPGS